MTSVPSRPRGKTGEMTGNSIFELIQQKEHFYTTINTSNLFLTQREIPYCKHLPVFDDYFQECIKTERF